MRRPDDVTDESSLASYLFVDRVPDSKALTDSLRAHLDRVRADAIDSTHNENVLTFYGQGGMGKTRLSQRLEHWLRGELGDATEWGPRPIEKAATVRWDLDHGDGNLDLVAMVLALRVGLGSVGVRTPAFDLALVAYLSGVRPGETVELLNGRARAWAKSRGCCACHFGEFHRMKGMVYIGAVGLASLRPSVLWPTESNTSSPWSDRYSRKPLGSVLAKSLIRLDTTKSLYSTALS